MSHDFEAQRRETFDTFAELTKGGQKLPAMSVVEFYLLVDGDDANWAGAEKALRAKGFATERDEGEDTLIVATKTALRIAPDVIWEQERIVSEIGLSYDFYPDGWEFGFDDK